MLIKIYNNNPMRRNSSYYARLKRAEDGEISVPQQIVNGPLRSEAKFIKVADPYVLRYKE